MAYQLQNFKDGQVLTHTHLNNTENGIKTLENSITSATNYWTGKRVIVHGDSGPAGSGLSNIKDGWPVKVCNKLGMTLVRNYSVGGACYGKRTGDYDECYVNADKWKEDKANGIRIVAEPLGVIAGIIPTTNPTSTAIFKSHK